MKKILLIMALCTASIFPQIALSTKTALTSMTDTDLMLWQEDLGSFSNRKQTWGVLKNNIQAYIIAESNAWANIQTFNGAIFSAGSHGGVTFYDSTYFNVEMTVSNMMPYANDTQWIGSGTRNFLAVFAKYGFFENQIMFNPSDATDSMIISYADKVIDFGSVRLTADTISGLTTTSWYENIHSVPDVNDSSLTVNYGNNVVFLLPGANMTNLEAITMDDMPSGSIVHQVTFWIIDSQDYNITFIDVDTAGGHTSDRNMQLAGDFNMDAGDSITLEWRPSQSATSGGDWQEVSRSDNR